jgi:hypothetical protein
MCRMFRRNTKTRSQHLRIFFYLKHYCSFLKIISDRGFRNDMKKLSIICSLCEWNGLFKDYEVKQVYFMQTVFTIIKASIGRKEIFLKIVLIK